MSSQAINKAWLAAMAAALLIVSSCSVKVDDKGENKNVDIRTPLGALQVRNNPTPQQTGLSVYPGAKVKIEGNDHNAANVNISSSMFGVKVVVVSYHSEDPAEKVIEYYKKDLQKYGNVLQCKGQHIQAHGNWGHDSDHKSHQLTCDKGGGSGSGIELKAGTSDNFHLVALEPKDKGTDFALVYVVARGEQEPM